MTTDLEPYEGPLDEGCDLELVEIAGRELSGVLGDARLLECAITDCGLDGLDLSGARLVDVTVSRCRAASLPARRTTWQDVVLDDCRLGGLEWYGATLTRVTLRGGKLDYLNLRGATLEDVLVEDAVVGELDLGSAQVRRLRVTGSRVGRLDLTGARLEEVDLRGADLDTLAGPAGLTGARISEEQLLRLAPALAAHLGIVVG